MPYTPRQTEPVAAANVVIGDLLVHDVAASGYLEVTDNIRNDDGTVLLWFATGDSITYPSDQRLHRARVGEG